MRLSGQFHAPAALHPAKDPSVATELGTKWARYAVWMWQRSPRGESNPEQPPITQ